jgi:hypothetical protein
MARLVSEQKQGQSFSRSFREGQIADRATRTFKILLESPTEVPQIQPLCGVFIGDPHPDSPDLYCLSFSAQYDGDSRMVVLANFEYEPIVSSANGGGGQAPQPTQPDIQPANWSLSSSLIEVPVRTWWWRTGENAWQERAKPAANVVGDLYDGITAMRAMVTISITQFDLLDPTRHAQFVGCINEEEIKLGTLAMKPHTVMLRGLSVQSQVKPWGNGVFRGWESSYEFGYMENTQEVAFDGTGNMFEIALGWDVAIPVSGWNCRAFNPVGATDSQDIFGQPLKHKDGKISKDPNYAMADDVVVGEKVRGMVKVMEYRTGGASQTPSASPIALNDDGTPRKITDDRRPLVYPYQVHKAINFTQTLGLRLYGY